MTRQQLLKKFEGILMRRRDALLRSLSGELEQVNPRDQRNVGDSADAAVDTHSQEISSGLVEAESRELANTERALERLREGSYGVCENCGKKIPIARLQALPYATMCIRCQSAREQQRSPSQSTANWTPLPPSTGESEDDLTFDNAEYVT